MKRYKQSLLEGIQSYRINTGYDDEVKRVKGKPLNFKEFPNHRFFVSNYYSPVDGAVDPKQIAIYEYRSGWRVGNGKTLAAAKADSLDRINRYGGETAIDNAVSGRQPLNK